MKRKPGIYFAMPRREYEQIDAVNYSTLKHFAKSAAHYRHELFEPKEPTAQMEMGSAVHCAILEPHKFLKTYAAAPQIDRRTKAGKDAYAAFLARAKDRIVLPAEDYDTVDCMSHSIWEGDIAAIKGVLSAPGKNEVCIIWQDEASGLLCKTLIDRLATFDGWTWIVDIKTARDADEREFSRAIYTHQYYLQAAMHVDSLIATSGPTFRRYAYIAVENTPPHCCAFYELNDTAIERGRTEYRKYLEELKQCRKTNHWPGYPNRVQLIDLPRWARATDESLEV